MRAQGRLLHIWDAVLPLQEAADDAGHVVGLVHVDVVIAGDLHELEPLGWGAQ